MSDPNARTHEHLWKELQLACSVSAHYPAHQLQTLLRAHKMSMLAPLSTLPLNAEDRQCVRNGEVVLHGHRRQLNEEFKRQCLLLSDELSLNELTCVELLREGYHQQVGACFAGVSLAFFLRTAPPTFWSCVSLTHSLAHSPLVKPHPDPRMLSLSLSSHATI
jgi:Nuclear pore complex scaffold, nucleoporins 186/192/205